MQFFDTARARAIAIAIALVPPLAVHAQPAYVDSVTAIAQPTRYAGACPGLIHFVGTIFVHAPATVTYRWERSDDAVTPPKTIYIAHGSMRVETAWRLGKAGKRVRGSERLRVLSPGDTYSGEASFTVACEG
jgi:hypothetical protein